MSEGLQPGGREVGPYVCCFCSSWKIPGGIQVLAVWCVKFLEKGNLDKCRSRGGRARSPPKKVTWATVVASEGSFGASPEIGLVCVRDLWVFWLLFAWGGGRGPFLFWLVSKKKSESLGYHLYAPPHNPRQGRLHCSRAVGRGGGILHDGVTLATNTLKARILDMTGIGC